MGEGVPGQVLVAHVDRHAGGVALPVPGTSLLSLTNCEVRETQSVRLSRAGARWPKPPARR